jgi:hypothetical protein
MNQLDDLTRRALCAADQPPPGVEDRVLAAILGPIGGGPGSDGGGGLGSAAAPGSGTLGSLTLVHAAKVVGATLGLAAGGVALLAITAAGVRTIADAPPRQASAPIEAPLEQREIVAAVAVEPVVTDEPVLDPPAPIEAAPPAAHPAIQKPSKPELVESEGTIEAELALMKTARSTRDHERALTLLDRHRREFASGVFAAEREVLRVEHLCALGRVGEARTIAAVFVSNHPDNPLRSRVDPPCPD